MKYMKINKFFVAAALIASVAVSAQKDELKALKKIYAKEKPSANDVQDYKANLEKLQTLSTEESDKVYTAFYKGMLPLVELSTTGTPTPEQLMKVASPEAVAEFTSSVNGVLEYEKKTGKKQYTDDINETLGWFRPMLLGYAVELGKIQQYKPASSVLYNIYLLDKKDQEKLYYAANYAVLGKDYPKALEYYQMLKDLNYSGEKTLFYAKNVASGQEESFPTKTDRDNYVKLKTHEAPRDEKVPSQRGEIYKNIALILIDQGKIEEAKKAIKDAQLANPEDSSLVLSEMDLYLKTKDMVSYERLAKEVVAKNPTDANLLYNLGVISNEANRKEEAKDYYKKAITVDPKYTNAYLNLAVLMLEPEKDIVDQMNKLGTSAADNKKFDALKKQREDLFVSVIPYLEKAHELNKDNLDVAETLLNVYGALEMMDKARPLKEEVRALREKQPAKN